MTASEKRFSDWLESIKLVDTQGKVLQPQLEPELDMGEDDAS